MRRSIVLILMLAGAVLAQGQEAVNHTLLVSTDWVAQHGNDSKVVILHVAMNRDEYAAAHIPGARFFDMHAVATMQGAELPPVEEMKKAFEAAGVSDDTRVIIYAPGWQPQGARAWFALDYLGHGEHAALLNGGIEQWMKENRPLSTVAPEVKPGQLTVKLQPEALITFDEVKRLSAGGDAVLLDTRPMSRYRAGHIPGAEPLFWEKTLVSQEEPVLKSPEELRKLFTAAGAAPGKLVVPYCEVGYQSSFGYFVARYLGYKSRNYDGSFSEWHGQKKEAVVRGDARR